MTHNKPSKEESLFPLPFLLFVLFRAVHNMLMQQDVGGKHQNLHKNQRRKEAKLNESIKEPQKTPAESKRGRLRESFCDARELLRHNILFVRRHRHTT